MLPEDLVAALTREPTHALAVCELVLAEHDAPSAARHLQQGDSPAAGIAALAAEIRAADERLRACPLRRHEAEAGAPARGLLTTDGGVITWRADNSTALTFADVEVALRLDGAAARSFTITADGALGDADGRRLRADERRRLARAVVLAYCEQRYIDCGYMYSGSVDEHHAKLCALEPGIFRDALESLAAPGIMLRRACRAVSYELAASRRVALIDAHDLVARWRERDRGAGYDCEGPWGQVTNARRERTEEQADIHRHERRVYYPGDRGGPAREGTFHTQLALQGGNPTLTLELSWSASTPPAGAQLPTIKPGKLTRPTNLGAASTHLVRAAVLGELDSALSTRYEHDGNLEAAFRALPVASPSLLCPARCPCADPPPGGRAPTPTARRHK